MSSLFVAASTIASASPATDTASKLVQLAETRLPILHIVEAVADVLATEGVDGGCAGLS